MKLQRVEHGVSATLERYQGASMSTPTESAYIQTVVAIFTAAFELGFDPYALAVQAKLDIGALVEGDTNPVAAAAEEIINESLLVAKIRRV